ncbi:sigma-70 region 4 domain-containing protein [Sphingomonas sp. R647]|uniref:sigma-70 region 4 domain-containing protein n=1 Tax=Sphingomonas sp. R647 TaxID=2875233 RepID=UPI001CD4DD44|nr:sigma-70 region 4 domain-containing protein [Sphingomonas sp. R647]MCA1200177.1 sigma-70 region 4 domain-containing protein [Sphingomonas sp. R647]
MTSDLRRLRLALDAMPAPDRAVFERARFEQLDFAAIAADLGIGIEEVERRLACAMAHLVSFHAEPHQH